MWGAAGTDQSPEFRAVSRPASIWRVRNIASLARPFRGGLKPARGRAVGPAGTHGFCFMVWTPDRSAFDTKLAEIDDRLARLKEHIAESQSQLEASDGTIARSRVLSARRGCSPGKPGKRGTPPVASGPKSQAERETADAHRGFVEERRKTALGTAQPAVDRS